MTHTAEELEAAENAGYDAATKFPSPRNCSFRYFATRDLRDAWQRGHDEGIEQRRKETA